MQTERMRQGCSANNAAAPQQVSVSLLLSVHAGRQGEQGSRLGARQGCQGAAVGGAQAGHHAVDAGDVVVGGADELEQTLHRVLPQHPGA